MDIMRLYKFFRDDERCIIVIIIAKLFTHNNYMLFETKAQLAVS